MRIVITLLAGVALWGCATTLTDEEAAECAGDEACLAKKLEYKIEEIEYNREVKRIEYLERYYQFEASCNAAGNHVWIQRRGSGSCGNGDCPPRFGDSYTCGAPLSVQMY